MSNDSEGVDDVAGRLLLPDCILRNSPSRQDGISEEVEADHRFWGCELIQEAGVLLKLPQVVVVTAETLLHRFYSRKSLKDFDAFRVAIGCLFLAAKVEEHAKRIREVLSVFYAIYRRRRWQRRLLQQQLLDLDSDVYCLWKDWLVMVERQVLIDLGFSLYNIMEHPHKYILYYVKVLDLSKQLAQKAWNFLNDSLRIDVCTRFRPEVIACAAIHLAARVEQVKLPEAPAWWKLFDVEEKQLLAVSDAILAMYSRKKIVWLDAMTSVDPFVIDDRPHDAVEELSAPTDSEAAPLQDIALTENTEKEGSKDAPSEKTRPSSKALAPERTPTRQASPSPTRVRSRSRSTQPKDDRKETQDQGRGRARDRSRERDRSRGRDRGRRSRSDDRDRRRRSTSRHRDRSRSNDRLKRRSRSRDRRRHRGRSRSRTRERSSRYR
ncbi:TPA: hypothetical protein N0F65_002256 [Lagenidium giganteum]|uniref:Cyclin-like domain-containing protein n=1 Tax=Lagenidium giganteum TaxID=4803 RepID=A0AAV2YLY9_9STRA|nr:TPA: hypothetical protein N0F65_002256 [Lagenidium giganteum]